MFGFTLKLLFSCKGIVSRFIYFFVPSIHLLPFSPSGQIHNPMMLYPEDDFVYIHRSFLSFILTPRCKSYVLNVLDYDVSSVLA